MPYNGFKLLGEEAASKYMQYELNLPYGNKVITIINIEI
jgi:hypothetical protein